MIYCFYHDDIDGHCAGAIIKLAHPDCEMHEVAHAAKSHMPNITLHAGDEVYIVDFAFTPEVTDELTKTGAKIHWLDHHISAIESHNELYKDGYPENILGERDTTKAGCELTWEYVHPNDAMPMAVYYAGRWDVWDHRNNNTIPFNRGLDMMETNPANPESLEAWRILFKNDRTEKNKDWNLFDQVLNLGLIAESMKAKYDKFIAKNAYYLPEWEGCRTVALNANVLDSYALFEYDEKFAPNDPEVFVWYFQLPNGMYKYALRAYPGTFTDVLSIAKKYGGGGHLNSAGFTSMECLLHPEIK